MAFLFDKQKKGNPYLEAQKGCTLMYIYVELPLESPLIPPLTKGGTKGGF